MIFLKINIELFFPIFRIWTAVESENYKDLAKLILDSTAIVRKAASEWKKPKKSTDIPKLLTDTRGIVVMNVSYNNMYVDFSLN